MNTKTNYLMAIIAVMFGLYSVSNAQETDQIELGINLVPISRDFQNIAYIHTRIL